MEAPYLAEFLESKGGKTATTYKSALRNFFSWSRKFDTASLIAYHNHLVETRSMWTVRTYRWALLSYLLYLEANDNLPDGINLSRYKLHTMPSAPLYDHDDLKRLDKIRKEQMPLLLERFQQYEIPDENNSYNERLVALRNRALFWTLYETAGRVSDVVRIDKIDIESTTKRIAVKGKGDRLNTLRFGYPARVAIPCLLEYFAERNDNGAAAFVSHSRNSIGQRLSNVSVYKIVKEEMAIVQMSEEMSPHDIRHYRASMMLKQDIPLHVIQDFLNHDDIATTRNIYAAIMDDEDIARHLSKMAY